MAQQNIDFGSFPNDPAADPIRSAFQKVQDNFTDLYATQFSSGVVEITAGAGLAQNRSNGYVSMTANISNITIKTSGFTNSTNSLRVGVLTTPTSNTATIASFNTPFTIDLAPNITTVNANFTGSLFTANFSMTGSVNSSLIPGAHETYDLGSPTRRWKDLYLSGNTLSLGAISISEVGGALVAPKVTVSGNIDAGSIAAGTVAGNLTSAVQPNITSVGTLTSLQVAGTLQAANMSVTGAFQAGTIYGNVVLPPGATIQAPGDNTQLIFNDSGVQSAVAGLTYNKSTSLLTIQGNISGGNITSGNATFTGNIGVNKVVATGNVEGSNIVTLGVVSSTSGMTTGANLAITNISGSGSLVTVTFAPQTVVPFSSGATVTINGVSPDGYNGSWVVVTGTDSSITFTSTLTTTPSFAGARIRGNGNTTINGVLEVVGNTSIGNITSVNLISGNVIQVSGNVDSGNLIASGILRVSSTANVGALYSPGDSNVENSLVRGNFTSSGTTAFFAGALTSNSTMTVQGLLTANANASINGTLDASGNISSGGSFYVESFANVGSYMVVGGNITARGEWANISGNTSVGGNLLAGGANIANFIVAQTGSVSGNVFTAQMFTGNGANITFVNASNVVGVVANASYSSSAGSATTATTADRANNISLGSYSNITGVGTLVSLNITGEFSTGTGSATLGGYLRMSVNNSVTAAGATQATATALSKTINVITSVASGTGVQLPSAVAGQIIYIINDTNSGITVFPASGQYIDAQAQNAGFAVGAYGRMQFVATSASKYYTMTSIYA